MSQSPMSEQKAQGLRPSPADLLATVDRDLCERLKDGPLKRLPITAEQVGIVVAQYLWTEGAA